MTTLVGLGAFFVPEKKRVRTRGGGYATLRSEVTTVGGAGAITRPVLIETVVKVLTA